jgi:fatty acid desaturase
MSSSEDAQGETTAPATETTTARSEEGPGPDTSSSDEPSPAATAAPGASQTRTDAAAPSAGGGERPRAIKWYRSPVPREELRQLNQQNDLLGALQTAGFLALLATSAGLAIYSWGHWPWYVTALLVFINGHFWHFLINGFHELVHDSVFRTRWLNRFFLQIFSFLGWYNHHHFWASHTAHHKYTLHPPQDLEVVLPQTVEPENLLRRGLVNVFYPYQLLRGTMNLARGRMPPEDRWMHALFPESEPARRRILFRWARILLAGHGTILLASLTLAWWGPSLWAVPLVITFPMMFGGWLHTLCNTTQHIGLTDQVPDFRLCCRTLYLNPFLQFLYWHMNYHIEHHMYPGVPCYKLPRLHRQIRHELPHCPRGLWETWRQVFAIQRRQREDPSYQYTPQPPEGAPPARLH